MEVMFILIKVTHGKLKLVSSKLRDFEEIEEVNEIYGRYDIIAKVVVESKEEVKKFIQNKLLITEGISTTETLITL